MSFRNWLRDKIIYPCVNRLPRRLRDKIKMTGTCLFGNGWGYMDFPDWCSEFPDVTEGGIKKLYKDLSDNSVEVLLDFFKYVEFGACLAKYLPADKNNVLIGPVALLFPGLEEKIKTERSICLSAGVPSCFDSVLPEVFCYHHGLKFAPQGVLDYIKGRVFLDLGAFIGDSSYVLSQYAPGRILAFEPSVCNGASCKENLKRCGVENVEMVPLGVSDQPGTLLLTEKGGRTALGNSGENLVNIVTVDGFLQERSGEKIGLIKADLEGMALKMVKGAVETIKRDRPVLLIAIYHNQDELMGVYKFFKENLPDYCYRVDALAGLYEITLIAWPEEADAKH